MKKIGIIGGGISGLAAAFLLKNESFDVTLFDKSEAVGGNIRSVRDEGFLIERGPNSLLKSPRLVDLIEALGLPGKVSAAKDSAKKRYILRDGKLKALPMSILKMATGDYFSAKAKLRLLREPFVKSKASANESVAEFFERRLGKEIVTRAADPFISGIYAGKPENLSIKAAFPRLYELEKNYGSLFLGMLRLKTEKPPKDFPRTFSFVNGVQTLTDKLAEKLGESVKTKTTVERIKKLADGKWHVVTDSNEEIFDALIISTPAETAANLIENLDANLNAKLREIYYPPVALVYFGVKSETIDADLDGFGFLIPSGEKRKILGTVWNSAVFDGRAPNGFELLTTFVGGSRNAEMYEKSDEEIFETVYAELKDILNLREPPVFRRITRWRKAIPQYNVGYDKIEMAIENFENENEGIFFCSNFYKGISVGDCVKNAYALAEKLATNKHEKARNNKREGI
jgi:oxygen-dependent protoporphyrinogen oxidase